MWCMRNGGTYLNRGLLRVCTVLFEMQQILCQAILRKLWIFLELTCCSSIKLQFYLEIELSCCLQNYAGLSTGWLQSPSYQKFLCHPDAEPDTTSCRTRPSSAHTHHHTPNNKKTLIYWCPKTVSEVLSQISKEEILK